LQSDDIRFGQSNNREGGIELLLYRSKGLPHKLRYGIKLLVIGSDDPNVKVALTGILAAGDAAVMPCGLNFRPLLEDATKLPEEMTPTLLFGTE
jgi:hypothetical protein